jgi:hypothetical protein
MSGTDASRGPSNQQVKTKTVHLLACQPKENFFSEGVEKLADR